MILEFQSTPGTTQILEPWLGQYWDIEPRLRWRCIVEGIEGSSMEYEEELREPVNRWVSQEGLDPRNEFRICWRIPDVVGVKENRIHVAVEMKLSDWRKALEQARIYTMFARRSYVAMPAGKQRLLLENIRYFRRSGIGILLVRETASCYELLESKQFQAPFSYL